MDRRAFLKTATALAAVGPATAARAGTGPRVVIGRDAFTQSEDPTTRRSAIAGLVHRTVKEAVQSATPEQAWKSLFTSRDTVGIKLNCLAPQLAPHRELVEAIVEGVQGAGVPPHQIIVFDKENRDLLHAGYEIGHDPARYQCYGTLGDGECPGYEERVTMLNDTGVRLSKIVTRQCSAIINVPVVKDHDYAGITAALKNHFGCIHNPEDFHLQRCDPAVADVNTAPAIRRKERLIVVDAIRVLYDGGPSFNPNAVFDYNAVFAGTDPVAIDAEVAALIDIIREMEGLAPIEGSKRAPVHVATAARYALGVANLDGIDLVEFDVPR
ncbi:MAG: DUF362 domain-containing protein [Armatimonadota bacterium]